MLIYLTVSQSTLNKMLHLKILEITDKKTCLLAGLLLVYQSELRITPPKIIQSKHRMLFCYYS